MRVHNIYIRGGNGGWRLPRLGSIHVEPDSETNLFVNQVRFRGVAVDEIGEAWLDSLLQVFGQTLIQRKQA